MKFMKYRYFYFVFSLILVIGSLISLAVNGLRPSIDFAGGSQIQIIVEDATGVDIEDLTKKLEAVYTVGSIQPLSGSILQIQGASVTEDSQRAILEIIDKEVGIVELNSLESVGPTLSRELLTKTTTAILFVAGFIMIYVWKQFSELKYGFSAILAMLHDSLILIGSFSVFGWLYGAEVDVLFVTALLTTLSFSVHDTIVVFDRIRELSRRFPSASFETVVDTAITETLSRSLNNSITIIIMLLTLVLLGGSSIYWFAVALLIGAVVGTYSSTFAAAPLLILWDDILSKKKK
ncbi:MAG: protein translocase subunit SecF [Microgenomates group bacterium]